MSVVTIIELGGIMFRGTAGRWLFTNLTDWHSLTQSKTGFDEIPMATGAFNPGEDYRQSAVISFKGVFLGDDHGQVLHEARRLAAWAQNRALQPMTVTDELGPTTRMVSVRHVSIEDTYGRKVLHFTVDVQAPDPLKYSTAVRFSTGLPESGGGLRWPLQWPLRFGTGGISGRAKIINIGTADARDLMEISGGGSSEGFVISTVGVGDTLRFERDVPDGSVVTFNPKTGRVHVDGQDMTRFLTEDDWFAIPAGGSQTIQFLALGDVVGSPRLTIQHQHAYW